MLSVKMAWVAWPDIDSRLAIASSSQGAFAAGRLRATPISIATRPLIASSAHVRCWAPGTATMMMISTASHAA